MSIRHSSTKLALFIMGVAAVVTLRPAGVGAQAAHGHDQDGKPGGALIKIVREATERFQDVEVAKAEGYVLQFGCVSGSESGAMGMHFVNGGLVGDGELDPTKPEIVIYEPQPNGKLKLIGADYLVLADAWNTKHAGPPQMMGQLFHLFEAPNRFGLPAFYTLHVWAWKESPTGAFVNWHQNVSCSAFSGKGLMTRLTRWVFGAALLTIVPLVGAIVTARRAVAQEPLPAELAFGNPAGVLATVTARPFEGNAFFADLGTNGRSCATCHRPAQAWSLTPAELTERFERTAGLDPVFRANDGANCEAADLSSLEQRRRSFSALLTRGLIRVALDVPANAEFDIAAVDDPYRCGAPLTSASTYRRPLPTTNLSFLSAVMWDGRASVPGRAIGDDLVAQAIDATVRHAQGTAPSAAQLREIVDFELGLVTAQVRDHAAGSLRAGGARGGPGGLARQPFCIGINDPLGMRPSMPGACLATSRQLDPVVFTLFGAWSGAASDARQAVARGEAIFNTRQFEIDNVPGLNGHASDPVSGPIRTGTCTVCHDTPNAGNHSVAMALDIGIAAASRRTADLPLYTLRHKWTGDVVQTSDPGRAMVTGKWKDIGKFKGPILRALAARPPYFHDGSAATLGDVVAFYDTRFRLQLTAREKADLLAFLLAL